MFMIIEFSLNDRAIIKENTQMVPFLSKQRFTSPTKIGMSFKCMHTLKSKSTNSNVSKRAYELAVCNPSKKALRRLRLQPWEILA